MIPEPEPLPANLVLGQAAGAYRERAPKASLRHHFSRTWIHRAPAGLAPAAAIVPDGRIDLQWIDGVLRIAGPDRVAKIENIPAGACIVGLRFRPGVAPHWLRVAAPELVGQRLPMEVFWGSAARDLGDWVSEAGSPEGVACRLEAALAERTAAIAPSGDLPRAIFRLAGARRHPGSETLRQMTEHLDLSERTLRRQCDAAFGYGPKTLARILRFQRFLRLARAPAAAGLATLAAEAGYADQAHLTRETRRLAGLTPRTILAQLAD